ATRPARSGDRPLPVPRHRTGDYARAARRGLRLVFPRRRSAGGIDQMTTFLRRRLTPDFVARALVGVLFALMSFNLLASFVRTGRVTGLLLLASESLVLVFTVLRRPAQQVDRSMAARVMT